MLWVPGRGSLRLPLDGLAPSSGGKRLARKDGRIGFMGLWAYRVYRVYRVYGVYGV